MHLLPENESRTGVEVIKLFYAQLNEQANENM